MTSHRLTIHVFVLALVLAVAGTGSAYAWTKTFGGTRDQVRAACSDVGGDLIEGTDSMGGGFSMCVNKGNNTGVTCGDDGQCIGSGPRASSFGSLLFGAGAVVTHAAPAAPGMSLSGPNDDSGASAGAPAPSAPNPPAPPPVIF